MNATLFGTILSRHTIGLIILTMILAVLQGCAGVPTTGDADSLRQRAQAYWKARVAGDPIAAWDYEEDKARGTITLQVYTKRNGPYFTKALVANVVVLPEGKGNVILDTAFAVPGISTHALFEEQITDNWIFMDGQWYHHYSTALSGLGL